MLASQTPTKTPVAFAASGSRRTIPVPSQVGTTPGAASFTTGFPPLTFLPTAAGGVPPAGVDFNGILNAITAQLRWQNAGGLFKHDADFSSAVGGYPKGALLLTAGADGLWLNTDDENTTNPDTGGAGWVSLTQASSETAKVAYFDASAAPAGYIKADGGTIGNAASGATTRANADTQALFLHYWEQYDNTNRHIQTSAGTPTTRGASAAADWAANKRMPVLEARGEWIRGWDDGRGVDAGRALGRFVDGEIKAHTHALEYSATNVGGAYIAGGPSADGGTSSTAVNQTGGTENTVRGVSLLACIKL